MGPFCWGEFRARCGVVKRERVENGWEGGTPSVRGQDALTPGPRFIKRPSSILKQGALASVGGPRSRQEALIDRRDPNP
jgi:hypothetical protein